MAATTKKQKNRERKKTVSLRTNMEEDGEFYASVWSVLLSCVSVAQVIYYDDSGSIEISRVRYDEMTR